MPIQALRLKKLELTIQTKVRIVKVGCLQKKCFIWCICLPVRTVRTVCYFTAANEDLITTGNTYKKHSGLCGICFMSIHAMLRHGDWGWCPSKRVGRNWSKVNQVASRDEETGVKQMEDGPWIHQVPNWLVVWNINFIFPYDLGMSSSQLTFIFFQRGGPTTNQQSYQGGHQNDIL